MLCRPEQVSLTYLQMNMECLREPYTETEMCVAPFEEFHDCPSDFGYLLK